MKTKKFFSYLILFSILLVLEVTLLTAVSIIPKNFIRKNVQCSAEYLCEKPSFFHLSHQDTASRIDRYADAILINLAWSCDTDAPLRSAIRSTYYYDASANENTNLLYAVTNNASPTYDYMRYWHGSLVLLRPLLIFFSIDEIYILCAIVLFCFLSLAAFTIYRTFGKTPFWSFLLAACASSMWYVPFSLEYMPTFLIAFASVPVVIAFHKKQSRHIGYLFFAIGSLTAYTDFLTTETFTCLLPLTLILLSEKQTDKKPIYTCIKTGFLWLIGYIGTWSSKWILYSVFIKKDGLQDALMQTAYRTGGEVVPDGLFSQMLGALLRNMRCLFPFSFVKDPGGMISVVIFFVITGMLFFLIKKEKNVPSVLYALWFIGCLPYLRYIVLSNHSFIHYFFTFRAQFISVFCMLLIFWLGTDVGFLKKEWEKIHKKK